MNERLTGTEGDYAVDGRAEVVISELGHSALIPHEGVPVIISPEGFFGVPAADMQAISQDLTPGMVAWFRVSIPRGMPEPDQMPSIISLLGGRVLVNHDRAELVVDDKAVDLPAQEYKILKLLMKNLGKFVSREEIARVCWGPDFDGYVDKAMSVHVGKLRRRLPPELEGLITTRRGFGYMLDDLFTPVMPDQED